METQDRIERGNLFQIVGAEKEKDLHPNVDLIVGTVRRCLSVDLRQRGGWYAQGVHEGKKVEFQDVLTEL